MGAGFSNAQLPRSRSRATSRYLSAAMKASELIAELQHVHPDAEVFMAFHRPPWRDSRPADKVMGFGVVDIDTGEEAGNVVVIYRNAT